MVSNYLAVIGHLDKLVRPSHMLSTHSGRLRQAPDVLYVIRKYAKILQ